MWPARSKPHCCRRYLAAVQGAHGGSARTAAGDERRAAPAPAPRESGTPGADRRAARPSHAARVCLRCLRRERLNVLAPAGALLAACTSRLLPVRASTAIRRSTGSCWLATRSRWWQSIGTASRMGRQRRRRWRGRRLLTWRRRPRSSSSSSRRGAGAAATATWRPLRRLLQRPSSRRRAAPLAVQPPRPLLAGRARCSASQPHAGRRQRLRRPPPPSGSAHEASGVAGRRR